MSSRMGLAPHGLVTGYNIHGSFGNSDSCVARSSRLDPPGLERSFAVWQGFWASLVIQGLDWAWMPGRITGFHRVHPERLEGNLGTPSPFSRSGLIMGDSCVGCVSLFRIGA